MRLTDMLEPNQYSPDASLTPDQHRVLSLLAEGNSIHAASQAVGVHRNTIRNWRRTVPAFAREAEFVTSEQAAAWHDQALVLAPQATAVLHEILHDPAAPAALRARIALNIFKMASDPKPKSLPLSNSVNSEPVVQSEIPETCTIMHNPDPLRRSSEPARNATCPCGSGQKYKRCCASYAPPKTHAAQAA